MPRAKADQEGQDCADKVVGSKEARPADPRISIVISGPDSRDIKTNAPDSSFVPYWFIRLAYNPPLVISIAETIASTDNPAKNPV